MIKSLPEGTVTILFTDVVGSTDLTTSRGDEAAQEIMRAQRDLTRQQVEEHNGHEIKGLGDGSMVAFTSARQAVACAVGIQRALEEHNSQQPIDEQVLVRIGLNTGEVIHEEEDLFGEAVIAAARIAAKAKGRQILVSDMVKGLLGRAKDVNLVDRGRFRLKGFPERWRLFEVVWQEQGATDATAVMIDRTPFVGRESERQELQRLLERAVTGQGSLVMIGGEPGVGKTRLAQELALQAERTGVTVRTGHCYEMEGSPPYTPFIELIQEAIQAAQAQPEALRSILADSAPEVARIVPELRRMFPDLPPPLELPPDQERRYMFNSIRDFVDRASRIAPLLILIDDLHWADDSSLLLLQHFAQHLAQMPVLMLATYRDTELEAGRPLSRTLEELIRQRLTHRIVLKRLPEQGVSEMLRGLSGQEPPLQLVSAIYKGTEGNAFFVEEVFHHLAEEGKLLDTEGRWLSDLEVSELDVPEGVRLVIGRRLDRVGEECRRVITAAAVIGRVFSFELLSSLREVDDELLLDALDDAERAHLITSTSEAPVVHFTFAHELIRQTLLSDVSGARRQRLHLRVADAMESVYAADLEEHAGDLAEHLRRAGSSDTDKMVRYLTLAGDRALASAAFEDALRQYETALSLQASSEGRPRADLLSKRGSALRSLGNWEDALSAWREAVTAYEELGDEERAGRISADVTEHLLWDTRFAEALETSRRGLMNLGTRVSADRCRLLGIGGLTLSVAGSFAGGDGMMTQALTMAEQIGDEHLLGQILQYDAIHNFTHQRLQRQLESTQLATQRLRAAGDLWSLVSVQGFACLGFLLNGRYDEAADLSREVEPLASRLGHMGSLMTSARSTGYRDLSLTADFDDFEEFARRDLEICSSANLPTISNAHSMLGLARFWRGQWPEAAENFEEAVKLEPPGFLAGIDTGFRFLWGAYTGDGTIVGQMPGHLRDLPRPGQVNTSGAWTKLLTTVEGLSVLGEREEALKLYPLVLEAMETGNVVRWIDHRLLHTVAGMAAAAGSQWEQAENHYQTALRLAHELPVLMEQPEARRWYARMLIDRNAASDRDKAFRLLTEAIAMYREIGMPKHVEMAETMLGDL
ncbi:MAG: AAA family ATPase [Chloroflexi bacterium]|nr:AAA family ATPase [Chloroflexota bacterium]